MEILINIKQSKNFIKFGQQHTKSYIQCSKFQSPLED